MAAEPVVHVIDDDETARESLEFLLDCAGLRVQAYDDKTVKGYYYRLALNEIARGRTIPTSLSYPIQVWTFGNDLAMVFLAGEVVSDYSLRIKREFDGDRMWVNGYSNDVPCYIPSSRALKEPRYGYEAVSSMYYYHKPSPFATDVEERIIKAIHDLVPSKFNATGKP